jgi:hypothetical protein
MQKDLLRTLGFGALDRPGVQAHMTPLDAFGGERAQGG